MNGESFRPILLLAVDGFLLFFYSITLIIPTTNRNHQHERREDGTVNTEKTKVRSSLQEIGPYHLLVTVLSFLF